MTMQVWTGNAGDGNWGTAGNWSGAVPVAGNDVDIPATANPILAGLDQHLIALGAVTIEAGAAAYGLAGSYLRLNCTALTVNGGSGYIDLGTCAITPQVNGLAASATGSIALYLKGSALTGLVVQNGSVGIGAQPGETASATTIGSTGSGATITIGAGVTTTTVNVNGGNVVQNCASTTTNVNKGKWTSQGAGVVGALNVKGGKAYPNSTGNVTAAVLSGGTTDTTQSGAPRTFVALKQNPGATFIHDPAVLAITTRQAPDSPTKTITSAA